MHFKIKSKTGVMKMVERESVLLLMSHTNLKKLRRSVVAQSTAQFYNRAKTRILQ